MNDLELVELAARRAASRVGGPTNYGLIQFADEVFKLMNERAAQQREQEELRGRDDR